MIVSDKMSSDSFLFSFSSAQLQHHGQCDWTRLKPTPGPQISRCCSFCLHLWCVFPALCHVQAQSSQPAAPVGSTVPAPSPCKGGMCHSTFPEQCPPLPSPPCVARAQEQECLLKRQWSSACLALTLLPGASGVPKMGRAMLAARGRGLGLQQSWAGAAAPPAPAEPAVGSAPARLPTEQNECCPSHISALEHSE